jgi:hypothetical protein
MHLLVKYLVYYSRSLSGLKSWLNVGLAYWVHIFFFYCSVQRVREGGSFTLLRSDETTLQVDL